MTLKEEFEVLRGEPIDVFNGNPMDIPCIETADTKKLCKKPLVSILMVTYNHEPFIRQAIEGVMKQRADFDFELVIGEDCSQDKTKDICFELQDKYPDKIRILWWKENLGGDKNVRRVSVRCRGEFISYCEGDDYWTDPLKLQKQVDIMRHHSDVGICFAQVKVLHQETGKLERPGATPSPTGIIHGGDFMLMQLGGGAINGNTHGSQLKYSLHTSSMLVRRSTLQVASHKYDISSWRLLIGDVVLRLLLSSESDVYVMPDVVSTYRKNGGGVTSRNFIGVMRDDCIVRLYFCVKALGMSFDDAIRFQAKSVVRILVNLAATRRGREQREVATSLIPRFPAIKKLFCSFYAWPLLCLIRLGLMRPKLAFWLSRIYWHMPRFWIFK